MIIYATDIPHILTLKTPNIVIVETAASLAINVDVTVLYDDDNKLEIIKELSDKALEDPTLSEMATFVNHKEIWTKRNLCIAFNNLLKYTSITMADVPVRFDVGDPCNEFPERLPCRVLYKLCLIYGLSFDSEDTLEDLHLRVLRHRATVLVQTMCITDLNRMFDSQIKLHNKEQTEGVEVVEQQRDDYEKTWSNFNDKKYLRNNLICDTKEKCIIMALTRFAIDISHSTCPIEEYNIMKLTTKEYVPCDPIMTYNYIKNKDMYDVDVVFNPSFPIQMYSDIVRLARDFGMARRSDFYEDDEINEEEDAYSYMQTVYLTSCWYRGWFPCLDKKTSNIELDHIDDIRNHSDIFVYATGADLMTYGGKEQNSRNDKTSQGSEGATRATGVCDFDTLDTILKQIKLNGLIHPFSPPGKKIYMTDEEINRLLFLAQDNEELLNVLNVQIQKKNRLRNKLDVFIQKYRSSCVDTQLLVQKIFSKLLEASMYMRGWDGIGDYPLETVASDDIELDDSRACDSLYELNLLIEESSKCGLKRDILDIPLVKYEHKTNKYEPSRDSANGYTLSERLYLLAYGNMTENEYSCMKESSNWFLATGHMVLKSVEIDPGFDVKRVIWAS